MFVACALLSINTTFILANAFRSVIAVLVNEQTQIKELEMVKMISLEMKQQFEAVITDCTQLILY